MDRVTDYWTMDKAGVNVNDDRDAAIIAVALAGADPHRNPEAADIATRRVPEDPNSLYFDRSEVPAVVGALGSLARERGLKNFFRNRRIRSLITLMVIEQQA